MKNGEQGMTTKLVKRSFRRRSTKKTRTLKVARAAALLVGLGLLASLMSPRYARAQSPTAAAITSSVALAHTAAASKTPASQLSAQSENDESGRVFPPNARPNGYSLSAIAQATAYFNTSFPRTNVPSLPCLEEAEDCAPLQILFSATGGDNSFSVSRGTMFYVPVILNDDSPPIIGSCPITATTCADFPNVGDRQAFLNYMYSPKEFGLRYSQIVVDGRVHDLGSDYLVEVKAPVPPGLADGAGTQYMTSAAFLTPLSPGIHIVVIRGNANGDDTVEVFTALGLPIPFPFSITYTVTVH